MGGLGSGRYSRGRAKTIVEDCLWLGIGDFPEELTPPASGTIRWTVDGNVFASAGFLIVGTVGAPVLELEYRLDGQEDIRLPVRLQTTRPTLGGQRWWFACPLQCGRRVGKLYLPAGGRLFGCRRCYDLTYESSQVAHRTARFLDRAERLLAGSA
jgi:hypothetical protein